MGGLFPSPAPTTWPSTLKAEHLKQFPSPTSWGTLQASKSVGTLGPGGLLPSLLEGRAPYGGHEAASGSIEDKEALGGPLCWVNMLPLGWGLARAHLFVNVTVRGKKMSFQRRLQTRKLLQSYFLPPELLSS